MRTQEFWIGPNVYPSTKQRNSIPAEKSPDFPDYKSQRTILGRTSPFLHSEIQVERFFLSQLFQLS